MKKTMLLLGALMLSAAAGYAQESRQDVSISGSAAFAPQVTGNSVQKNSSMTIGLVASYRYMLTPRSALEVNYGYQQNTQYYQVFGKKNGGIHVLQQEILDRIAGKRQLGENRQRDAVAAADGVCESEYVSARFFGAHAANAPIPHVYVL